MQVVIDTRYFPGTAPDESSFLAELFARLVKKAKDHHFIMLHENGNDLPVTGDHITSIAMKPLLLNTVSRWWWYDIKLPALLKKYKADLFISLNGYCSMRTGIPQFTWQHGLLFLHSPEFMPKQWVRLAAAYTKRSLAKATAVLVGSAHLQQELTEEYGTAAEKIKWVPVAVDAATPLKPEEKEQVRNTYTQARPYLLYTGSIHARKELITLLKAFSIFKKRQKTSMKLVLAGEIAESYATFTKSLAAYKYRDDVVLIENPSTEELAKLTGAAYMLVQPSPYEATGLSVLPAIQSGVAVITTRGSAMQEICGDAALYAESKNHTDLAEQIMRLYKDEALHRQLVQGTEFRSRDYTWERAVGLLEQVLSFKG